MQNHIFFSKSLITNNLKRFAMENNQFPQTAKERIFYADPGFSVDENDNPVYTCPEHAARPNYFYLHRKAEELNGYDICDANAEALSDCLRRGAVLCMVQYVDGTQREAICFSVFGRDALHVEGLICLLDDLDGILSCFRYFDLKVMPSIYEHELECLDSIGILEPMRQLARSLNPY